MQTNHAHTEHLHDWVEEMISERKPEAQEQDDPRRRRRSHREDENLRATYDMKHATRGGADVLRRRRRRRSHRANNTRG